MDERCLEFGREQLLFGRPPQLGSGQSGRAEFGREQYGSAPRGREQSGRAPIGRERFGRAQFGRVQFGRAHCVTELSLVEPSLIESSLEWPML